MAYETISWALAQKGLKPAVKLVLVHLANFRNQKSGRCNPSQKTLAHTSEQSVSTINKHLGILEARGLIKRVRQYDAKTGAARATHYHFPAEKGADAPTHGGPLTELTERPAPSFTSEIPCPSDDTPPLQPSGDKPGSEAGREHGRG